MITGIIIAVVFALIALYFFIQSSKFRNYVSPEQYTALRIEHEKLQSQVTIVEAAANNLTEDLKQEREKMIKTTGDLHAALANVQHLQKKLTDQKDELQVMHDQMQVQFKNIANNILEENSQKFTRQNKDNLDIILTPFKNKIKEFEDKVQQHYDVENKEKASLKQQIIMLYDLNKKMSEEAQNLTKALKGDNKTQGSWGEFILESVLEKSGLVRDREYVVQESFTDAQGKRLQPDVVILLPEQKNLVVDSKISLIAYERFVNSTDETERQRAAKDHVLSLRTHIKSLSEKNYQQIYQLKSLDFVLLFVPIESAFALGVQSDAQLFAEAFDRNIVLVSPSTLLATLRTVSSIWRQDNQNKNAAEISRLAGIMYDKLANFADDMNKLKSSLTQAENAYDAAMKKISEGKGNAMITAQKIKALGAATSKQISEEWINEDISHIE